MKIKKRVECPYCKELICEGAKKCKHCGEILNRKEIVKRVSTFAISGILLLIVIGSVFAEMYFPNKNFFEKKTVNLEKVESVTSPVISPSISPTQIIKKPIPTKYAPKYDGTRTGRIVEYYSYCEKKNVNIYENELIPYTTKAGKQIYSTKTDIQCYENEYNSYVNQNGSKNYTNQTSAKVQWTSTEGIVDGTYYCYQDRVNELTRIESIIKIKMSTADSCSIGATPTKDSCLAGCVSSSDYSSCSKICWDNYTNTCLPKYQEVGNSRLDLMNKISEICP